VKDLIIDEFNEVPKHRSPAIFPVIVAYGVLAHALVFYIFDWYVELVLLIGSGFASACAIASILKKSSTINKIVVVFWIQFSILILAGFLYYDQFLFTQNEIIIYFCAIFIYYAGIRLFAK
jgi:hypothetical protein